jgi:hypothetical protein
MVQDVRVKIVAAASSKKYVAENLATATPRNPNNVLYYHLVIQIIVVIITLHSVLWFKLPTMTLVTELGSPLI